MLAAFEGLWTTHEGRLRLAEAAQVLGTEPELLDRVLATRAGQRMTLSLADLAPAMLPSPSAGCFHRVAAQPEAAGLGCSVSLQEPWADPKGQGLRPQSVGQSGRRPWRVVSDGRPCEPGPFVRAGALLGLSDDGAAVVCDVEPLSDAGGPAALSLWDQLPYVAARASLSSRLTAQERDIIRHYYGLEGWVPATLKEIAERLGVTGSRVQQLKERALDKLGRAQLVAAPAGTRDASREAPDGSAEAMPSPGWTAEQERRMRRVLDYLWYGIPLSSGDATGGSPTHAPSLQPPGSAFRW